MKNSAIPFRSNTSLFPKLAVIVGLYASFAATPASACASTDSVYLGSICATAATWCPQGYLPANGALQSVSQNQALFSVISNKYGGDGSATFAVPDLQGRSAVGVGTGPGLSPVTQGQRRGTETVTQTLAQMPSHNHLATSTGGGVNVTLSAIQVSGANSPSQGSLLGAGGTGPAGANIYVAAGTQGNTVNLGGITATQTPGTITVGNNGGNQPMGILPPQLGVTYCIAAQGLYPPRD